MNNQKQQVVDRIKQANNILVTVSANPSVDQLAACIGLTLILNELDKHATAVFSGAIPSTMEFLQPEKTLEKNTDSLRDFIIALDKSKADKLRYKVEDKVVRIFITPYKTSISQKDLEFSQGDFNVDVVVALGVHEQQELDQAITMHGRILHDATVVSINKTAGNALGSISWQDAQASSLSEMVTSLLDSFDKKILDKQMATALLTGIVAETDRFRNEKTTPATMSVSAKLMTAGADQQLVATKLEEPIPVPEASEKSSESFQKGGNGKPPEGAVAPPPEPPKPNDGTLEINHDDEKKESQAPPPPPEPPEPEAPPPPPMPQIRIDEQGQVQPLNQIQPLSREMTHINREMAHSDPMAPAPEDSIGLEAHPTDESTTFNPHMVLQPPSMGGTLTANTMPEALDPSTDALSLPQVNGQLLSHDPAEQNSTKKPDLPPLPAPSPEPALEPAPEAPKEAAPEPPKEEPVPPFEPEIKPAEPAPEPEHEEPPIPQAPQITYESLPSEPAIKIPEPEIAPEQAAPIEPPAPTVVPDIKEELTTSIPTSLPPNPFAPHPEEHDDQTLSEIEESVHSPHVDEMGKDVSDARSAVENAIQSAPSTSDLDPIAALNANPMADLHEEPAAPPETPPQPYINEAAPNMGSPADKPLDMPLPPSLSLPPANPTPPTSSTGNSPQSPPPVPPPMMPPFVNPNQ